MKYFIHINKLFGFHQLTVFAPHGNHFICFQNTTEPLFSLTPTGAPFVSFTGYFVALHLLTVRAVWTQSSGLGSRSPAPPAPLLTAARCVALIITYVPVPPR